MDFGTTNSGMAVFDGKRVQMLSLDSNGASGEVARTALYVTNDQTIKIGREGVDQYFEQNIGRPVKMKKVWVGEVEVYGADMFYIADVYAWIDVLSPGRLFLSIKSGLRDPDYQGTVVGQNYYSLENLIAVYLSLTRMRAERFLGREVREVVLGRPVRFSTDPEADELAQGRLLEAAFRAGYEKVYLQYEPIAAAYAYAMGVKDPQNIVVFDFGGGTLDITVMHLGSQGEREVLSTGGIPVAGDIFDQKLTRARLPKYFGEGSHYGPSGRRLPLPKWIFNFFSNWQKVFELQTFESREFMNEIASTADDKKGVDALISMVANNYTLQMFDEVETAKRKLSTDMAALIRLNGPKFHIAELVTRTAFEQIIRNEIQTIDQHLDETVSASGLTPKNIDAVIRTGGSSNIPAFRYMLMDKFGREKVLATDIFSSVASGLGIIAAGIESGKIAAKPFTQSGQPAHVDSAHRPNVSAVNLELLQRRMASQEWVSDDDHRDGHGVLLVLDSGGSLASSSIAGQSVGSEEPVQVGFKIGEMEGVSYRMAMTSDASQRLLMITSNYRFLLTTPDHLADLQELNLEPGAYFQLKKDEHLSALGAWSNIRAHNNMLLVTSRGYARVYKLDRLIESIEGPTPLRFDQPLSGLPLMVEGCDSEGDLIVVSDSGRAVRFHLEDLPIQGIQAFNRRDGERMVGALIAGKDDELVIVTADGFGRRISTQEIPVPAKPNTRGRVMVSRKVVAGISRITPGQLLYAMSGRQMIPFDPGALPRDSQTRTKSYPIPELKNGHVLCLVDQLRSKAD
jgi:hypothetical chaperone protein